MDKTSMRRAPLFLVLGLILFSFGLPLVLGHAWYPLPFGSYLEDGLLAKLGQPKYLAALDNFSFPHVDWPWRLVAREQLLQGSFPLWNPFASLGLPFIPQYQNQLLFPIEWLEILGGPAIWGPFLIIKIWLAILGTYRLVSLIVEDELEKGYVCLTYAFSAFFIWFHSVPAFVNSAMMVPWLLWSAIRLCRRQTNYLAGIGVLGLVSGLSWLSGQPQMAALSHLAIVAWALLYIVLRKLFFKNSKGISTARIIVGIATGCFVGILISLPQVALFLEAMYHGYSLHSPNAYAGPGAGTAPMNFSLTVFPFFLGQLMWPWNGALFPGKLNAEAFPFFVGAASLFLFIAGTVTLSSKSIKLLGVDETESSKHETICMWSFLILSASIILLIVLATLGVGIWKGPLIGRINLPRYCTPILSLCMAIVAARGLGKIGVLTPTARLFINTLTIAIMLYLLWLASAGFEDLGFVIDTKYQSWSVFIGFLTPLIILLSVLFSASKTMATSNSSRALLWAVFIIAAAELLSLVRYGFNLENEAVRIVSTALFCLAAFFIILRFYKMAALAGVCGLLLHVIIFVVADSKLNKLHDPYINAPAHIKFLKEMVGSQSAAGRVLASQDAMTPNVANGFGIAELSSLNPMQIGSTASYLFEMLTSKQISYTTPNAWPGVAKGDAYPSWKDYAERRKYYNLLGVRYLVDTPSGELNHLSIGGLKEIYHDKHVRILEDEKALPRLYVATSAYVASDAKDARKYMLNPGFDPTHITVVEDRPGIILDSLKTPSNRYILPITPDYLSANELRFTYSSEHSVIFVQTDAYYPGWRATVNGVAVPIVRVNGVFRGIVLEPGRSVVEIHYSPYYFQLILAISFGALVVSIALIFFSLRRRVAVDKFIKV